MPCPLSYFISLRARRLKAPEASHHPTVSISQFFRRPKLGILVLKAHHQIAQPAEYRRSNVLRAEHLLYVFDRIVGLSTVRVRSRKVQSGKGLSGWLALG